MTVDARYYAPELVADARAWIADVVGNPDDVDDASDDEIVLFVRRNYDGGWGAFVRDSAPEDDPEDGPEILFVSIDYVDGRWDVR
jgi:hypothetical protein